MGILESLKNLCEGILVRKKLKPTQTGNFIIIIIIIIILRKGNLIINSINKEKETINHNPILNFDISPFFYLIPCIIVAKILTSRIFKYINLFSNYF